MLSSSSSRSIVRRCCVGALVCVLLMAAAGCSGSSTQPGSNAGGGQSAMGGELQGGSSSNGGSQALGSTTTGGMLTTGGVASQSAGGHATGGTSSSGGSDSTAGVVTGGTNGTNTGGVNAAGGSSVGGGSVGSSGGKASGGRAFVGGAGTGGAIPTGGVSAGGAASGGTKATGGAPAGGVATGGASTTTVGGSGDRCDVGVYDAANPPKTLTLSGDLGTHDPSAIEANGKYYLFATGLGAKTSSNLTTWADAPRPFAAPAWAQTAVPGVTDLWAADVSYFGGKYHLYYSASTFGSNRSCIGHATKADLASGTWTDQGAATICSNVTTSGDNWNAIDPAVVLDTAGTPWMVFGSFWSGIKLIQLDQDGKRVGTALTAIANRPSAAGALEGPYIVRRCGYYYLFTSWDKCCDGANSTYNIRVARSASVTGPYSDKSGVAATSGGGTLLSLGDNTWKGPGGQSVMVVGTKAYLVYHAYRSSDGVANLRIADLVWDADGWPVPVGP